MADTTSRFRRRATPSDQVTDIVDSVKAYARQETLEPLKGAARWVAVGTVAAVSLGLAMVFLSLAVLRLSQDLGGTALDGAWSFVHYLLTLVVVSALVALSFSRISQRSLAKGE
ncbi:MAG: hypothetical protein LW600_04810 [Ilumatobacteraceae bacterium]|jgi:hypothetical protein|nr:hypothetical protein [Ilumatobacteraceae bacterium]